MNLSNFKLFCDAVRCRSFSRGAAINGITQSAASQKINHLESEFGAQLIDRSKRPFVLTSAGEICYRGLRDILRQYEVVRASIEALRHNISGTVRIAAIYSVGLHVMNESMQAFMSAHPKAKVRLVYLLPAKVYQAVLAGEADLGILSYPQGNRDLSIIPLRSEKMALVCHPDHHFARLQSVKPSQLQAENYVAFDRDLVVSREIDRYFKENGVSVRKIMEFDNVETIKQAVEIGAGLSILPEPTVRREVDAGSLAVVDLEGCTLARPIAIIHHERMVFTPAITKFIEILRSLGAADEENSGRTSSTVRGRSSRSQAEPGPLSGAREG